MTSSLENLGDRLTAMLDEFVQRGLVLGVAAQIRVANRSWTVCAGKIGAESDGTLSEATRFRVGCINKLAVALSAHDLAERGMLDMDAELGTYNRELATRAFQGVTMRHLLSHTAGYVPENLLDEAVRFGFTWPSFLEFLDSSQPLFSPGKVFNYTHSAYVVASRVLAQIAGRPVSQLIAEISRLDLAGLSADDIAPGHAYRGREFATLEPVELAPFWDDSLEGTPLNITELANIGECLLMHLTKQREHRPATEMPMILPQVFGPVSEELPVAFGCGFARFRSGRFGLSSAIAGHTCAIRVGVHDRLSVALALNSNLPVVRDRLSNAIIQEVTASLQQFSPLELEDLIGFYQGTRDTGWRVELNHDTLILRRDPMRPGLRHVAPIQMRKNDRGQIIPIDNQLRAPMGFFREPGTGTPCLMVGTSSHKLMDHV
jgi:hypothetical protein